MPVGVNGMSPEPSGLIVWIMLSLVKAILPLVACAAAGWYLTLAMKQATTASAIKRTNLGSLEALFTFLGSWGFTWWRPFWCVGDIGSCLWFRLLVCVPS